MGNILWIMTALASAVLFLPFLQDTARYPGADGEVFVRHISISPLRRLADGGNLWLPVLFFLLAAGVIVTSFMRKNMKCPVWLNRTFAILCFIVFIAALILSSSQSLKY